MLKIIYYIIHKNSVVNYEMLNDAIKKLYGKGILMVDAIRVFNYFEKQGIIESILTFVEKQKSITIPRRGRKVHIYTLPTFKAEIKSNRRKNI